MPRLPVQYNKNNAATHIINVVRNFDIVKSIISLVLVVLTLQQTSGRDHLRGVEWFPGFVAQA